LDDNVKPALEKLVFPPSGLFLRLDACSRKDGVQSGKGTALFSVDEILLRVTTSARAMSAVRKLVAEEGVEEVRMFFFAA
jgi:hypothetical protein